MESKTKSEGNDLITEMIYVFLMDKVIDVYNLLLCCNLFDRINIIVWGDFVYHRIRDLREDKDLNQEQLAKLLNISQTTYSRYESGKLDIPTQL